MSYLLRDIAELYEHPLLVDPAAKLLLNMMARFADDDGKNCFPSVEKLCHLTLITKKTFYKHLDVLKKIGIVKVSDGGKGRGHRLHFEICFPPDLIAEQNRRRMKSKFKIIGQDGKVRKSFHEQFVKDSLFDEVVEG